MLDVIPSQILADLKLRHAEPQRHYHDWSHVEALLRHMADVQADLHDTVAVIYAIGFHDAVYNPKASDNEARSAQLLLDTAPPIDARSLARAHRMIEATAGHFLPDDLDEAATHDCAHFLDMDLGIFGAPPKRFDIYEDQIRREYAHVPSEAFREGRLKILRHFAQRDQLYFTDWGSMRFEGGARRNLARSIAALEK